MSDARHPHRGRRSLRFLILPVAALVYAACERDPLAPATPHPAPRGVYAASALPAGPVTGCATLEVRIPATQQRAAGFVPVSVTTIQADGCGGPLRPVLDSAASYNAVNGMVRLPVALLNEGDVVIGAPARLTARNDDIAVLPSEGAGAVTLGAGEGSGSVRDSLVWSYDDQLAPERQPQLLRPAGRSRARWVALRIEPGVTAFRLTLRASADRAPHVRFAAGRGVVALPAGDTVVPRGTELSYGFTADAGFENVIATLDGEPAPATGRIVADADHVLFATADVVVTLAPAARPLYDQARAVLDAADPVGAYQRFLSAAAAYASTGPAAAQQVRDVGFLAFDPIRDSAALRRVDEALANHVFYVEDASAAGSVGLNRASPLMAMAADADEPRTERTEILYVNGVFTTYDGGATAVNELRLVRREVEALSDARVRVGYFHNRTWPEQSATREQRQARCVGKFWLQRAYMGENSLRPFLARCMNDDSYRRLSDMDLAESVRQVWAILNNTNAAEADAVALADTIQARRAAGQHVIVVPHSQGNLMTNQAVHRLRGDGRFAPERDSTCIGVVSLASPVSGRWDVRNDNYLAPVVVRGDPIPDLVPGANVWPRLDTELSGKITSNPLYVIAPQFIKAFWAMELHDVVGSYMRSPTSRAAIRDGLLHVYRACAASKVSIAPASATVSHGGKVKLTARVANAYGDSLPGGGVRWTSEAPAVASVDETGMVTGGNPHPYASYPVEVVAKRFGARGTATVTVTPALPTVVVTAYARPKSVMRVEGASGSSVESTSIYDGELPNNWTVPWDGRSSCDQRTTLYHTWPGGGQQAVPYEQVCWFEYGFSLSGQPSPAGKRIDYYLFQWALQDGTMISGPWAGLWADSPSFAALTGGSFNHGFDQMPWSGVWVTAVDDTGRRATPIFAPFTY